MDQKESNKLILNFVAQWIEAASWPERKQAIHNIANVLLSIEYCRGDSVAIDEANRLMKFIIAPAANFSAENQRTEDAHSIGNVAQPEAAPLTLEGLEDLQTRLTKERDAAAGGKDRDAVARLNERIDGTINLIRGLKSAMINELMSIVNTHIKEGAPEVADALRLKLEKFGITVNAPSYKGLVFIRRIYSPARESDATVTIAINNLPAEIENIREAFGRLLSAEAPRALPEFARRSSAEPTAISEGGAGTEIPGQPAKESSEISQGVEIEATNTDVAGEGQRPMGNLRKVADAQADPFGPDSEWESVEEIYDRWGKPAKTEPAPEFWQMRRKAMNALKAYPLISEISQFSVPTGKGIGPGSVRLERREIWNIWQTINLQHAQGVRVLVPQEDITLTLNMDRTLDDINNRVDREVVGCKQFSSGEHLETLIKQAREEGEKCIVLTAGQRSIETVNRLAQTKPALFVSIRSMNISLPEGYGSMPTEKKTFYQASMLMRANLAALYERDNRTPMVEAVLKSMLKDCLDCSMDEFLGGLAEEENETPEQAGKRIVDCSRRAVKLLSGLVAMAVELLKLQMTEFYTAL
jgi:hypothetical protein